jgi:hypothetical protein
MNTYTIHRNNRRFNTKKFESYEQARSYVRKWLRKTSVHSDVQLLESWSDYSWNEYRNPEISRYGFSVKRVEG